MEVFDGFISAIASEFKIRFHKDAQGSYTTHLEFDNGRSQEVLITLAKDESGDRIINYYSIIGKLTGRGEDDLLEHFHVIEHIFGFN